MSNGRSLHRRVPARASFAFLVTASSLGLTGGTQAATPAVTAAPSTLTACANKLTGTLRLVSAPNGCITLVETPVAWNNGRPDRSRRSAGRHRPAGPKGDKGDTGSCRSDGPRWPDRAKGVLGLPAPPVRGRQG